MFIRSLTGGSTASNGAERIVARIDRHVKQAGLLLSLAGAACVVLVGHSSADRALLACAVLLGWTQIGGL